MQIGGASGDERRFEVVIEDGQIKGAQHVLRAEHGDTVEISFRGDRRMSLHLHGYDIEIMLEPGAQTLMSFEAHATGRFPIEIHGEGAPAALIYLEVHPR